MKKIVLLAGLLFILSGMKCSSTSHSSLELTLTDIIIKPRSGNRPNIYMQLRSGSDSNRYYIDNDYIRFAIEYTHKIILSDYIDGDIASQNITLKVENFELEGRQINEHPVVLISSIETIYPDYPGSDLSFDIAELNPGRPPADYYHRYIDVPVSYDDPDGDQFKLYYELCSDYDEDQPTILIPTDGQRTLSQVGWADRYKEIFGLEYNTVIYEFRGMPCSEIAAISEREHDWRTAYELLNSGNVVEDIERVRRDLMGSAKISLLGGSGTAMIGLKYLEKYHAHVDRAFLMSFFTDARSSSVAGVHYFHNFLVNNQLYDHYESAIEAEAVSEAQLLFLIQRLLYYDEDEVKALITELSNHTFDRYTQYCDQFGSLDYFVRSAWLYKPWTVVFMYETNIPTQLGDRPDINYPFLKMAEPITKCYPPSVSQQHRFDVRHIEDISTEILLVGGTLDQVVPLDVMEAIQSRLPNSRLAVFEAYHCLQAPENARECRNELANLFFKYGNNSQELNDFLPNSAERCGFIRLSD